MGTDARAEDRLDEPFRLAGDDLLAYVRVRRSRAPYFPVPTALREALLGWRPVLGEVEGLMATAQLLLFSTMRNEHGVQLPYGLVYRAFGLTRSAAQHDAVYTEPLLALYRERVDPAFDYMEAQYSKGLCRTVVATGFPDDVVEIVRQFKAAPDSFDEAFGTGGYVYLLDGRSANRRNTQAQINEERTTEAMINDPAVPMPRSAELIQTYLNVRLDAQLFANGRYGVVSRVPNALAHVNGLAAAGASPFDTEAKADAARRQLAWVRAYPRPLYKPCDHSPRLKADHFNQLMNVPSVLRPVLYTERDVELDLDKAHMAALVVVARKLGMTMPLLEEALHDADRDVWEEFAGCFDAGVLVTPGARRKAAKRSYAVVFGAGEGEIFRVMLDEYRDRGGKIVGEHTFDPFRPVLEHPLMAEIHETAQTALGLVIAGGGLEDAEGRWIALEMFTNKKDDRARARALLAYVCASYEQVLVAEAFRVATDELDEPTCYGRPAFQIWLYQADGFTLRLNPKAKVSEEVERLQAAVQTKADELGMPTRLSRA